MKEPHTRCQKGLHDLTVPGAVRIETVKQHGKEFKARRCKQCQYDRYRRHNSHRPQRKRTTHIATGTLRGGVLWSPRS